MGRSLNDALAEFSISEFGECGKDMGIWRDRYIDSLRSPSQATIRSYKNVLNPFVAYCKKYQDQMPIENIGAAFINNYIVEYIEALADKDLTKGTIDIKTFKNICDANKGDLGRNSINISIPYPYEKSVSHRLTVIKQLLRYITNNNIEQVDYVRTFNMMASVRVQKRKTDYYDNNEMMILIELAHAWPEIFQNYTSEKGELAPFRAWRNSFMVLLYALTGLRSTEALMLQFEDFEFLQLEQGEYYGIRIQSGKGNKERQVIAPVQPLRQHLEKLHSFLGESGYIAVQSPRTHKPISYTALYLGVKPLLEAAGINKSGFHNFRRGYATQEIAKGRSITKVALQLGHSSVSTTYDNYVKNNPFLLAQKDKDI
jgi:integrase/recombinase XerD